MSEEKFEADIDDWMGELSDEENPFDEEARIAMEGPTASGPAAPPQPSAPPVAEPVAAAEAIDQSDIDALLGNMTSAPAAAASNEPPKAAEAVAAAGAIDQSDLDALLGNMASAPTTAASTEESAGLDQSDIDSLFGGGEAAAAAPEMDQDHINQLLGEVESLPPMMDEELIGAGIDQALDATLLAGNTKAASAEIDTTAPVPLDESAKNAEFGEFYQANMDELLSSACEQTETANDSPGLDQSDLDQLLGVTAAAPAAAPASTPSQEEMDQLFAKGAGEEEELFPSEPPAQPEPVAEEAFGFAGNELDDSGDWNSPAEPDPVPAVLAKIDDEESTESTEEKLIAPTEKKKTGLPVWMQTGGSRRALWTGAGASLILLLSLAGYFTMQARHKDATTATATAPATAPVVVVVEPTVAPVAKAPAPPAPIVAANQVPQGMSMEVPIPAAAKEVIVALRGQDPDNDPLEFVIVELPTAGKLTGKLPNLTYIPTGDFTGEDRFVYRASDGKALSEPAVVHISGAPATATPTACATKSEPPPNQTKIGATNFNLKTMSTAALDIDWQAVWHKANPCVPFSKKVAVEIIDKKLQGTLTRLDNRHHRYDPAPNTDGKEWLRYRFTLAGNQSKIRQLNIQVNDAGYPQPTLALCALDQQTYAVGDTVVLDASPTRNDRPGPMAFSWKQTAGVPVRLEHLNQAGSAVSFVVPSSFYAVDYPEPVIRVTVKDQAGQLSSRDITIKVQPSRQAALWNGLR